jgi:hypothetical protein
MTFSEYYLFEIRHKIPVSLRHQNNILVIRGAGNLLAQDLLHSRMVSISFSVCEVPNSKFGLQIGYSDCNCRGFP